MRWRALDPREIAEAARDAGGGGGLRAARKTLGVMTRSDADWDGEGTVGVTADAVAFEVAGAPVRRADRDAIVASVLHEKSLWLRRDGTPDLLVVCERMSDAQRLASALTPPSLSGATSAEWRKVSSEEVEAAAQGWFGTRAPRAVLPRLDQAERPWMGPGAARVTPGDLVLEPAHGQTRTVPRRTIRRVVVLGSLVWVRRSRGPDWLIRFGSASEAQRLRRDLDAAP